MTRPYLGNPKYTIEVLQKYGFVFQKRFGQNLQKMILYWKSDRESER